MSEPYYCDDLVTLYHGDCRSIAEWLAADVLVTDPPYGVGYAGIGGDGIGGVPHKIAGDADLETARSAVALWGTGAASLFANHESLAETLGLVRAKHRRTRVMAWHKTNVNGATPGNPWLADLEFAVCGVPEWPKLAASGLIAARRHTGNPAWQSRGDAYLHPTQKPVAVMEQLLVVLPDGAVADPFAGSGSTLVAARNLGRRAIGVELEERYCEVAARRLAQDCLDLRGDAS